MLTINKPAPHRLDITPSGKIDAEMMCAALDDLIEKFEGV
jgi:hypothetical protein